MVKGKREPNKRCMKTLAEWHRKRKVFDLTESKDGKYWIALQFSKNEKRK